jgi:hypothetical protein
MAAQPIRVTRLASVPKFAEDREWTQFTVQTDDGKQITIELLNATVSDLIGKLSVVQKALDLHTFAAALAAFGTALE